MQLKMLDRTVLAIGAHADDIEVGCGATLAKFSRMGAKIYYMVLSLRLSAMSENYSRKDVLKEIDDSCKVLKIPLEQQFIYDFENRQFFKNRQEILQALVDKKNEINPNIILTHSLNDMHQDHYVVAEESFRAFKNHTVLGHELAWNRSVMHKDFFIIVNREDLQKKINAINCFYTQKNLKRWKLYFHKNIIKALAITNGAAVGCEYAECFETNRLIENSK